MEELLIKLLAVAGQRAPELVVLVIGAILVGRYLSRFIEKRIEEANARTDEANARAEQIYEDSKKREDRIIEAMDKNNEVNCQMLATLQRHSDMISGVILEQTQMRDKYDRMSNDITEIKTMLKH